MSALMFVNVPPTGRRAGEPVDRAEPGQRKRSRRHREWKSSVSRGPPSTLACQRGPFAKTKLSLPRADQAVDKGTVCVMHRAAVRRSAWSRC